MNWERFNWLDRAKKFLGEVKTEMSKVSFPSREEVIGTTVVVVVTSIIFAIYLSIVDAAITGGYAWIVKMLG
jgi:preprotein translocase subunit SecE